MPKWGTDARGLFLSADEKAGRVAVNGEWILV